MNQSSEFLQGEAKSPLEVIAGLVAKCRSQEERIRELEGQLQVEAEATAHLKEVIEGFNRGENATMLAEVALAGLERIQKQKEGQ